MNSYVCKIWYALTLCTLLTTMPIIPMGDGGEENEPEQPSTVSWGDDETLEEKLETAKQARLARERSSGGSTSDITSGKNISEPSEPTTPTSDTSLLLTLAGKEVQKDLAPQQENATTFTNATGDAKTEAAYTLLGIQLLGEENENFTDQDVDDAYEKQKELIENLRNNLGLNPEQDSAVIEQANQILDTLTKAKNYLSSDIASKNFEIINPNDLEQTPGSASSTAEPLDKNILGKLNLNLKAKLTQENIIQINHGYDLLPTDFQKEEFIKNMNRLAQSKLFETLDITDIIIEAANDAQIAQPKSTSSFSDWVNRQWNRYGWGKTEKDYVKTVVTQALNGNTTSTNILQNDPEFKKNFQKLDRADKQEILKTAQEEAFAVFKKAEQELDKVVEKNLNPSLTQSALWAAKQKEIIKNYEQSVEELTASLKPMLNKGQQILISQDRSNFKQIINLIDFTLTNNQGETFQYNPTQSVDSQVAAFIKFQGLQVPKFDAGGQQTNDVFNHQVEEAMLDYYGKLAENEIKEGLNDYNNPEFRKNFQNLDPADKQEILKTAQNKAFAVFSKTLQELNESYENKTKNSNETDLTALQLFNSKEQELYSAYQQSVQELITSLQPMLDPEQKILVSQDYDNFKQIINLIDFNAKDSQGQTFVYNLTQSVASQLQEFIDFQGLQVPQRNDQGVSDSDEFNNQVEEAMLDYYGKKTVEALIEIRAKQFNKTKDVRLDRTTYDKNNPEVLKSVAETILGTTSNWSPDLQDWYIHNYLKVPSDLNFSLLGEDGNYTDELMDYIDALIDQNSSPAAKAAFQAMNKTLGITTPAQQQS